MNKGDRRMGTKEALEHIAVYWQFTQLDARGLRSPMQLLAEEHQRNTYWRDAL